VPDQPIAQAKPNSSAPPLADSATDSATEPTTELDRELTSESVCESDESAHLQRPVTQQVPPQRWQIFPPQPAQSRQIAQATALSPLLAQVLINRGIYTPEQAWEFLDPETLLLPSPLDEFPDLDKSIDLLVEAIATQQKILICGDYDADGMTSTALLMRSLRYLGAQVDYDIPSRMDEGYGINQRMVEAFHAAGGAIILTVDNGIAAYDPVERARALGLSVIITDHHDLPERLPPANAILNPKLIREASPYKGLAGVGVAYVLAVCLAQRLNKMQDLTATLLALFTLGTIADLAPLTGVNRRWVRRGLKLLPKSSIPGVQALIEVAGLSEETALKPEAIGFRLGPRINAVGRIADPQIVIDLLTTEDLGVALQRAMQCEEANKLRRQMCEIIEVQAIEWCEEQQAQGLLDLSAQRVLVIVQPEWHHGVIGIVASRLVERYGVPVFIGTYEDKAKKEIRGSARSIPEFNVFDALQFCDDLLDKYGGHRAAGGFSFQANKLRQIKSRLSNFACKHLQLEHLKPLVAADVQAQLAEVDLELYTQIDQIHPCGIENPDPVFWTANVTLVEQKVIGKTGSHLKLTVTANTHLEAGQASSQKPVVFKAIAWRWGCYYPLPRQLDIAYRLRLNEWQGRRNVELELIGVRPVEATPVDEGGIRPWSELPLVPLPTPVDEASEKSEKAINPSASGAQDSSTAAAKKVALSLQQALTEKYVTVPSSASFKLGSTLKLPNIAKAPKLPTALAPTTPYAAPAEAPLRVNETQSPKLAEQSDAAIDLSPLDESGLGHLGYLENLPVAFEGALHVEFYYAKRRYKAILTEADDDRLLIIENAEGHLLQVQMSDRQGFLYLLEGEPQAVDIADLKYFNLIHAGLNAIEVKQKNQLLIKKDELLAEKDAQISTMKAQIDLLEEKITQLSAEQQQQFAALETELQSQETTIQGQEAQIEQLQIQANSRASSRLSNRAVPLPSAANIQQQVRAAIGDSVWFCLQAASQKELQAAYKNYQTIDTGGPDAPVADYSAAGIRLCAALQHEILTPFLGDLDEFLQSREKSFATDGLAMGALAPTLGMLPALLADQWRSFAPGQLAMRSLPESGVEMVKVSAPQAISSSDRQLLSQFFDQWEHPMATCFSQKSRQAASSLDQISKLQIIATQSNSFLYQWQYELLHLLIAGKAGKGGLLRQLFALPS
jgi:single-stranded-DNA-specific exonuclease